MSTKRRKRESVASGAIQDCVGEQPSEQQALAVGLEILSFQWSGDTEFDVRMRLLQNLLGIATTGGGTSDAQHGADSGE